MDKINIALLWTVLLGTLSGSLWIFNNIAWASDIERIEVRLIVRDLRELREELRHEEDPAAADRLEQYIEELLDDLCRIEPDHRECQ
jgi:hypothetical protein